MFLYYTLAAVLSASHVALCVPDLSASQRRITSDAHAILARTVSAMGGQDILREISGLTMTASNQTLTQTYGMYISDVFVAASGNQNISYKYSSDCVQQSIDRTYTFSPYWVWALPALDPPMAFSLVVETGNDSAAYFRNGSNSLVAGPGNLGFADAGLTEYLVGEAQRSNPLLAFELSQSASVIAVELNVNGLDIPAVFDPATNTTLALHQDTYLPWFVRRQEYNKVFGQSTSEIFFTDYRQVNFSTSNVLLPHRRQMVYNGQVVEDTIFDDIAVNPNFKSDQFTIQPSSEVIFPAPHKLDTIANWTAADIGPFYETALWGGNFARNLNNITATHPIPDIPQLWRLDFADDEGNGAGYAQLVIEINDGVLVADAPYPLSGILLDWISGEIGKPVKYLWPSHHHHDHAYGSADFVATGAEMVVPEIAEAYWNKIPNSTFITFNETHPFVVSDDNVQIRALWRPDAPHAEDWSWLMVTKVCPREDDQMAVFEADAWDPDSANLHTNLDLARQWLDWLAEDGVSNNTVVVTSHGGNLPLQDLIDITGYVYPTHRIEDFKPGGDICRST